MELKLSSDKQKKFVEYLWLKAREAEDVTVKLSNVGFICIEGKIGRVIDWAFDVLVFFLPREIVDDDKAYDQIFDEFNCGADFETFYEKWFEEGK